MNIAYSCNDYYISQTGISMISLFENNREEDEICVYFIAKDVSTNNIEQLREIANKYNRDFVVVDFESIAFDLRLSAIGRHIETIYSKVFFSRIEGLDKIIYLDSDTVVVGSLKELWEENLEGCYMGVVETYPTVFYQELSLPKGDRFFNDGMAICNVAYCRDNDLITKVLKVVDEFDGNPPTLSEGALNKVCYGRVKYISPRYNLMSGILFMARLDAKYLSGVLHYSEEELLESSNNPIVIHYLSAFYNRPWFKHCRHPYKDEYTKYKLLSPWRDEELKDGDISFRLKLISYCYRTLGVRNTERIGRIFGRN